MRKCILAVVFLAISPLLAQQPQPVPQTPDLSPPTPTAISSSEPVKTDALSTQSKIKIVLLEPIVRIENSTGVTSSVWLGSGFSGVRNKKPVGDVDQYERVMLDTARSEIGSKASIVEPGKLDPAAIEVCNHLNDLASRLSRGNINDEASKLLTHLAELDPQYTILAQSIRVQMGVSGTWNPNTGGISSSTASTLLQTALISARTGAVIWKSEQIIRYKAAKPDDPTMSKALLALFNDFRIE